jgi:hypothetical protein
VIHSIIVPAGIQICQRTYTEIYGGSAGFIVINGVTVSIGQSTNVAVWVRSVSGGTGCYL